MPRHRFTSTAHQIDDIRRFTDVQGHRRTLWTIEDACRLEVMDDLDMSRDRRAAPAEGLSRRMNFGTLARGAGGPPGVFAAGQRLMPRAGSRVDVRNSCLESLPGLRATTVARGPLRTRVAMMLSDTDTRGRSSRNTRRVADAAQAPCIGWVGDILLVICGLMPAWADDDDRNENGWSCRHHFGPNRAPTICPSMDFFDVTDDLPTRNWPGAQAERYHYWAFSSGWC